MTTIKPVLKPKKNKKQSIGYWSKKADKKLQELGRDMYAEKGCIICGGEYSCLHHIVRKSTSTHLRYKWKNVVPICVKHHFKIHNSEPTDAKTLMDRIIEIKGIAWYEDLMAERKSGAYTNASYAYYRSIYENLEKIAPYKV